MSDRGRNILVGVFVLGAVLLLVGGLFALGLRHAFEPHVTAETAVAGDVVGLAIGSAVELRGIRVGEVTDIGFTWRDYPATRTDLAVVRFKVIKALLPERGERELEERVAEQVTRGLRVRIRSQALTGTSVLSLERVDPKENPAPKIDYEPKDLYIPSASSQLTRMLDAIERTLDSLKEIRVEPLIARLEGVVASIEVVGKNVAAVRIDRLESKANVAADEVVLAAQDLHAGIASAKQQIEGLKLGESGERLTALLDQLNTTTLQLQKTLAKVGTVDVEGLNEAITSLRRASDTLDTTLQEVRAYPAGAILGGPPRRSSAVEEKR